MLLKLHWLLYSLPAFGQVPLLLPSCWWLYYMLQEWFFILIIFRKLYFIIQFGRALNYSGLLVQVHSRLVPFYARAERIWQSTSVIINPQTGNGLECGWRHAQTRWSWEFEDFEKTSVEYSTVERVVGCSTVAVMVEFFGSRPAEILFTNPSARAGYEVNF